MTTLRCSPEPRARKPKEFDGWLADLVELADSEGESALVGIVLFYAPLECVQYLASQQPLWTGLLTRARYADAQRFRAGVSLGRELLHTKEGR